MEKRKPISRPLSQSEGFGHIENYFRSGLRPAEYYNQHGLSEWQFYSWRKRYLLAQAQLKTPVVAEKKFHRVNIESPCGIELPGLEIHYPHGVRLVLGSGHSIGIEQLTALIKLVV
jgi:hypothetical protein